MTMVKVICFKNHSTTMAMTRHDKILKQLLHVLVIFFVNIGL